MLESMFAWIFLVVGIVTQDATYFVASGAFAIAARIYLDKKGGSGE